MRQLATLLKRNKLLVSICLLLLAVPFVARGNYYYLGGDDMRLYFVYPWKYLQHYVFNTATDNTLAGAVTGYTSVAYYAPLLYIFSLFTYIPVNTQNLALGVNFSLGFLFFFLLSGEWIPSTKNARKTYLIRLLASLFYIFNPLFLVSLYKTQLLSIFLVSVYPTIMFFLTKALREDSIRYSLMVSLIVTLFSGTNANLPWLAGALIPSIFLLMPCILATPRKASKHFFIIGVLLVLQNLYWIYHFINSLASHNMYITSEFLEDNLRIATGVSYMFTPFSQVFLTLVPRVQDLQATQLLNIIFPVIIVLGICAKILKQGKRNIYWVFLGFLVTWYLYNPNIGGWGSETYVWLTSNVPFWGMFKNMYDKFALPFALFYSLVFAVSSSELLAKANIKIFSVFVLLIVSIIGVNNYDFIVNRLTVINDHQLISGKFNDDYYDLLEVLAQDTTYGRVLWLPLNGPTYANIEDSTGQGMYSGLSPLRVLIDKDDSTGRFSFINQYDWFAGEPITESIEKGNIQQAAELISRMNISHIVLNKEITNSESLAFLYGENRSFMNDAQLLIDEMAGDKLFDFGNRYTLYQVNDNYNKQSYFSKLSNDKFVVEVYEDTNVIDFYEPFNKDWNLEVTRDGEKVPLVTKSHEIVYGWANRWALEENIRQGDIVTISFTPNRYNTLYNYTSISVIAISILGIFIIKDYKDE